MPAASPDEAAAVARLLAAALATIDEVPFCWVITPGGNGGANARVVKCQRSDAGDDGWTRWFLTPRIGRKSGEISAAGRVTLAYQHTSGNAYVALAGPAELIDDRDAVDVRFRGSIYDDPEGKVATSLIAVRVRACTCAASPTSHGGAGARCSTALPMAAGAAAARA